LNPRSPRKKVTRPSFRQELLSECTIHLPASGWPNMQSMSVALALFWRAVHSRSAPQHGRKIFWKLCAQKERAGNYLYKV
jgi:hypothetical protein